MTLIYLKSFCALLTPLADVWIDCGDISVILRESDPRLSKNVTMAEFNVAFGVYRDVICEVFPERRAELDSYLAIISDLAMSYGGILFYEYHK